MARTTITSEVVPANTPLIENALTMTAADVANGNQFAYTGRDLLLVQNTGAGARNFTPTSVAINGRQDPKSAVAQSIPAGEIRLYNFRGEGWQQTDGFVYINGDNAEVKFCPIVCPA